MNKIYSFYNINVPVSKDGSELINPYYSRCLSALCKDGITKFPSKDEFPSKVVYDGGLTYHIDGTTAHKQFTTLVETLQDVATVIARENELTDGNGKIDKYRMGLMHETLETIFQVLHETFGLPLIRYDKATFNLMCVAICDTISKDKRMNGTYYAFKQKSYNRNAVRDVVLKAINITAYGGKQSDIRNACRIKK